MITALSAQPGFKSTLICFAVKEEARFFLPPPTDRSAQIKVQITGMGRKNATNGIREAIALAKPERVLTCGFAGGLNPKLKAGEIVYDCDLDTGVLNGLKDLAATQASFYCAKRVAVTAAEKRELWESAKADAVEMESSVIRTICQEAGIPAATIRVISDAADQDLPLDFNALMTGEDRINYPKLFWSVLTSPAKIPRLIDFQRQTVVAARRLGEALTELVRSS